MATMWRLVCLLLLSAGTLGDESINVAVDTVVGEVAATLQAAGLDKIDIADISYHWKYHRLPGTIHCNSGWAEALGSLQRAGEVGVGRVGESAELLVPLRFASLAYGYQKCGLTVVHLVSWNGHARASVLDHALQARVAISRTGGSCSVALTDIGFTSVGDIRVTTGGGIAHQLEENVVKPISNQMNKDIVERINQKLRTIAPLVFAKSDLCQKIQ